MTRNTYDGPQGNSPYGGYPPQPAYGQQQQDYGNYPPGGGQGYDQQYQQHSGPGGQGYGADQGSAQSYYARNDQPYQQYPNDRPQEQQQYQNYQSSPAPGYTPAPSQYNQQYGGPPPQQDYPPYGQQQQYPPHHMQQPSGQVDEFRSPFDQPHAQPNASGHFGQPGPYPPGPENEQDRGLMGALAGGAAGAYGGHKMHHGVLGTIGGAVAGSMLEDAYKKKGKKDKKHKEHKPNHSRRDSSSSSSSSSSDSDSSKKKKKKGMSAPAGNFHASSRNVYLEGRSTLVAESADVRGHFQRTAIDLNDVFTNTNGKMHWARGGNFAGSARNIRLADNGNCLEAELGDGRGGWTYNKVDLNERITNDNGRLHLL